MFRRSRFVRALLILSLVAVLLATTSLGVASAATLALSTSAGTPYTLVTLTGLAFIPNDTIAAGNITFAGKPWNTDVIQIDNCGVWTTSLRVPTNAVIGPNTIRVAAAGGTVLSTTFTVTAPPVTVSPGSGPPYTMVTLKGYNFVPLATIPVGGIKFNGAPWNTAPVLIDGSGTWTTSMRIPAAAPCCGGKPILITTAGTVSMATFTILASVLTISPTSGAIGTKVSVCVSNLTPDATIPAGGITFGGVPWNNAAITVDNTGYVCSAMLTVPQTTAGTHVIAVSDGNLVATKTFTVTQPVISISPTSAYKGQTVTVSGSGWPLRTPGSGSITFAGSTIKVVTPDENGSFNMPITIPFDAGATSFIGAFDVLGNTALSKVFSLKSPTITLSPQSGLPGTTATISGIGFQSYIGLEQLRIGTANLPVAGVLTDSSGAFSTTFTIPGFTPGGYIVSVRIAGVSLSTWFTVIQSSTLSSVPSEPTFPLKQSLASIADKLIIVWEYYNGEWKMYDPDDELGSTLDVFTSGRGYWIKVIDNCSLFTRNLTEGWNLLGW